MRWITGKGTFKRAAVVFVVGVFCALMAAPMPAMARKKGDDGPMRGDGGVIAGFQGGGRKFVFEIDGTGGGSRFPQSHGSGATNGGGSGDARKLIVIPGLNWILVVNWTAWGR